MLPLRTEFTRGNNSVFPPVLGPPDLEIFVVFRMAQNVAKIQQKMDFYLMK